jgi:hypothetical protein
MNISLIEKNVEIRLSRSAQRALAERSTPLQAEMELLFSCLIRKRVRFSDQVAQDAIAASDRLSVRFRPAMTSACVLSDLDGPPPLDDFPIANPRPYVPRWLSIDYRRGQWVGDFGY